MGCRSPLTNIWSDVNPSGTRACMMPFLYGFQSSATRCPPLRITVAPGAAAQVTGASFVPPSAAVNTSVSGR